MYPIQYHKETQKKESKFTSDFNDTIKNIELKNVTSSIIPPIIQVYQPHSIAWPKKTKTGRIYITCCKLGEYQLICDSTEDSNGVI
jgi:hypothetical protein